MTWHTATIPGASLASLMIRIRTAGGTIACSVPGTDGVRVTWTTTPGSEPGGDDPAAQQ